MEAAAFEERETFRLGQWTVVPSQNLIRDGQARCKLTPKAMRVLLCLAQHEGHTVSRDTLLAEVWGDVIVTEAVLSRTISLLRKGLGEDAADPRLIETIAKVGYRLMVPVIPCEEAETARTPDSLATLVPVDSQIEFNSPATRQVFQRLGPWLVAAAIIAAFVLWQGMPWRESAGVNEPTISGERMRVRPFTSFMGNERYPQFSPDSGRVAYSWNPEQRLQYDIYVQQVMEEHPLRITDSPDLEISPTWSPDGGRIAFIRSHFDDGNHFEKQHVYIVPSSGGEERRLTREPVNIRPGMSWSPDGQWLAVAEEVVKDKPFQIVLLSLKNLDRKLVTKPSEDFIGDWSPKFSPDGRYIAFLRAVSPWNMDLYVFDNNSNKTTRLTEEGKHIRGMSWSGNGEILFSSNRTGRFALWRQALHSNKPDIPRLVSFLGAGQIANPSLSPDGRCLAYESWQYDANLAGVTLKAPAPVINDWIGSSQMEIYPSISPDAGQVAFISDRSGHQEIWLASTENGRPSKLTEFDGPLLGPLQWDREGTALVFQVHHGQNDQPILYSLKVDEQVPVPLTDGTTQDFFPSWSQNGECIIFGSKRNGDWQIYQMPAAGGEVTQVTKHGGVRAFESEEGYLYFDRFSEDRTGVWRVHRDGGPEELVIHGKHRVYQWFQWALSESGIYYTEMEPADQFDLNFYDFADQSTRTVARLDRVDFEYFQSLTVAPRDLFLLYTHTNNREADLMLWHHLDM